ncbi:MAG: helix-turn-helix transcriptional regulator [Clostridia bacterium]|nr:helix-turn-helix transcriptional regulator [Clostridia bacterium]
MFNSIALRFYGRDKSASDWWLASLPAQHPKFRFLPSRLHYVHSGAPTVYCGDKAYKLEPGKLYFFPQNLSLRASMEAGDIYDHTVLTFFMYPPTRMSEALVIDLSVSPLLKSATDVVMQLAEKYPMTDYTEQHTHTPLIESYCVNLLKLIDEHISPIETVSSKAIADALSYIHENYQKELTVEELSARTNYQKHAFMRKFKQIMGVSPYKYIKDYRLSNAYYLLRTGNFTIAEVAEQIGYNNSTSFSHAFKQHFGIYPKDAMKSV